MFLPGGSSSRSESSQTRRLSRASPKESMTTVSNYPPSRSASTLLYVPWDFESCILISFFSPAQYPPSPKAKKPSLNTPTTPTPNNSSPPPLCRAPRSRNSSSNMCPPRKANKNSSPASRNRRRRNEHPSSGRFPKRR